MSDIHEFQNMAEVTNSIASEVVQNVLESKKYIAAKSSEWVDEIGSQVIEKLKAVSPNFKYIVSSFIIQKVGAGVHYESVSHWNAQTDGAITTKYENDSMICLCSVFGIAI